MTPPAQVRDLRIDFFRGFCLLSIYTLHVNPNLLKKLTVHALGFSDAAEVFVFLSGFVCGLVYEKALLNGLVFCQLKALRRCAEIYLAHLFTLVVCLGVVSALFGEAAYGPVGASLFLRDPARALERSVTLSYFAYAFNILPLYILFLVPLPVMLWLGRRYGRAAMLGVSFLLYAAVQLFPEAVRLPGIWGRTWYFNPFAWQFLFFVGAALGSRPGRFRHRLPRGRLFIGGAFAGLVLAFLLKSGYAALVQPDFFPGLCEVVIGADRPIPFLHQYFPLTEKRNLQPLRLVHFALLVYLCWAVVPRASRFWQNRLGQAVIRCGQNTLAVFCFGVVLTNLANLVLATYGHSLAWQLAANGAGWIALLAFGQLCHATHQVLSQTPARRPAAPPEPAIPAVEPRTETCFVFPVASAPGLSSPSLTLRARIVSVASAPGSDSIRR
ncbi:MAG TPA: OpgC domain-containing protein [Gemmataceae bacterium]|nr:OpgC domain-containing protein [Gemmataceae bacterium]